jgi:hypothetical protein
MVDQLKQADEEQAFQDWYAKWAKITGINPNPDDPEHYYDYRGAYKAGVGPSFQPEHNQYRWPDQFKQMNHPNLSNEN